ncbi:MAG: hypothetical protein QOD05_2316 [Microbacteriaceae bacterium]|nr:hypothetical protein [Microbacteriaceae bacterium]
MTPPPSRFLAIQTPRNRPTDSSDGRLLGVDGHGLTIVDRVALHDCYMSAAVFDPVRISAVAVDPSRLLSGARPGLEPGTHCKEAEERSSPDRTSCRARPCSRTAQARAEHKFRSVAVASLTGRTVAEHAPVQPAGGLGCYTDPICSGIQAVVANYASTRPRSNDCSSPRAIWRIA